MDNSYTSCFTSKTEFQRISPLAEVRESLVPFVHNILIADRETDDRQTLLARLKQRSLDA